MPPKRAPTVEEVADAAAAAEDRAREDWTHQSLSKKRYKGLRSVDSTPLYPGAAQEWWLEFKRRDGSTFSQRFADYDDAVVADYTMRRIEHPDLTRAQILSDFAADPDNGVALDDDDSNCFTDNELVAPGLAPASAAASSAPEPTPEPVPQLPQDSRVVEDGVGGYEVRALVDPSRGSKTFRKRRFRSEEHARAYEAECASGEHVSGLTPLYSHARKQGGPDKSECYGYRVLLRREDNGKGKNKRSMTFHKREYGGDLERARTAAVERRREVLSAASAAKSTNAKKSNDLDLQARNYGDTTNAAAREAADDAITDGVYTMDNPPRGLTFECNGRNYRFRVLCDNRGRTAGTGRKRYDDFNVVGKYGYGGDENAAFAAALAHWRRLRHVQMQGSGRIGSGAAASASATSANDNGWTPDDGSDGNPAAQGSDDDDSELNPYDDNDPL